MKKSYFLLIFFFATFIVNAQEEREEVKTDTILVINLAAQYVKASDLTLGGFQYERGCKSLTEIYSTSIFSFKYGKADYLPGIEGQGFEVSSGSKTYFQEFVPNLFFIYNFSYGRFEFDTSYEGESFEGKYEYVSPFAPELGYRVRVWNITAEAFVGTTWRVEIVGARDVDNKNMDNWAHYFGFRLGYQIK